MGFLGIGAMEALVILVIALIIFGPGRLPEIMGEAGRTVRDFRKATREITGDFEDSISEVRSTYQDLEREVRSTASDLKRDTQRVADEVNTAVSSATVTDNSSGTVSKRPATPKRLDQVGVSDDQQEDVSQHVLAKQEAGDSSSSESKDRRGTRVPVPAASPNGVSQPDEDLLSSDDGDDLLSVDS